MSTLTKEWLLKTIAELEEERDATPGAVNEDAANALAAMKLALASLEAEPVAYMYKDILHADARFSLHTRFGNWSQEDINEYEITEIPLYTAPPAPVSVPDEATPENIEILASTFAPRGVTYQWDRDECNAAADSWNACHAAMLQGADQPQIAQQNIPEIIPATQFKPVADLYGLTSPTGDETSFTFDAVEARDFIDGGWSCQEYVELERFQEAVSGNSPVIPDGWVMVPAEPTEEMCDVGHVGVDVLTGVTDENEYYSIYGKYAAKVYRAMIAAAPQQEVKSALEMGMARYGDAMQELAKKEGK